MVAAPLTAHVEHMEPGVVRADVKRVTVRPDVMHTAVAGTRVPDHHASPSTASIVSDTRVRMDFSSE